jgi:Alpha-L-arabinofuranosidase B (ABFB) domain
MAAFGHDSKTLIAAAIARLPDGASSLCVLPATTYVRLTKVMNFVSPETDLYAATDDTCPDGSVTGNVYELPPLGSVVALEGVGMTGQYIQFEADADVVLGDYSLAVCRFRLVAGLADPKGVSFQMLSNGDDYLRHQDFKLWTAHFSDQRLFKEDATFYPRTGLASVPGCWSFESKNYPGFYIRQRTRRIVIEERSGDAQYDADASWNVARIDPTGIVIIYERRDFGGRATELRPGNYNMNTFGLPNDTVSSLRVPPGMQVTLYQHANFQGKTKLFTADAAYVGDDFDNITSGIVVASTNVSPTP